MKDEAKTKKQLISELTEMRRQIAAWQAPETQGEQMAEALRESEARNREEARRASEEKYFTMLKSFEEGYYEVDLEGNCTFFNDALCRIVGYKAEEMPGLNYRLFTAAEAADKLHQAFSSVLRTGE